MKISQTGIFTETQKEFIELFNQLGWRASEVARALEIGDAAISMLLKGKRNPRPMTLSALRQLVERQNKAKEHVGQIEASGVKSDALHEQLADLAKNDPSAFEAAKITIQTLHKRISYKEKPKSNSTAEEVMDGYFSDAGRSSRHPRRAKKSATRPNPDPSSSPKP